MSDAATTPVPCRNCGAPATGRYCPSCGQETRLALPTTREFLREAAGRYVALDGRLWRTLGTLLARPGFLTREYFAGRRRRYIRPARLFLVLSIAMFAVLRLVGESPITLDSEGHTASVGVPDARVAEEDAVKIDLGDLETISPQLGKRLRRFRDLPRDQKTEQLYGGVFRFGPYALFALLPAFALLLKIAYAGRRRRYPDRPRRYTEHLVFAAHDHAFMFLVVIIAAALPFRGARVACWLWAVAYFAWSLHAVYGGRWSGVLARGSLIACAYTILFAFAVAALVVAAALLG